MPRHCALGGVGGFISSGLGRKFSLSKGDDCGTGAYVLWRCLNSTGLRGGDGWVIQLLSDTVEWGRVEGGRAVESLYTEEDLVGERLMSVTGALGVD